MAPYIPIDHTEHGEIIKKNPGAGDTMGKSRKVSKGFSSRFIPDYRHVVETVAESDGLGSSGRLEPEIISIQGSRAPGRQGYSFNMECLDGSAMPFQFFSLGKMSTFDKKELEVRLVGELELVRKLQRKISSFNTDVLPPADDGHSYQVARMRDLDTERVHNNDIAMSTGKKKCPPGKNGARSKVEPLSTRRNEQVRNGLIPESSFSEVLMKQCRTLLSRLMGHQHAWIFNKPVDIVAHKIPDYFNIIKHPMDLGTVRKKLSSKQYMNPLEFAADVRLTFNNAMTYNPVGHDVHLMAENLSKFFEARWKSIEKKIPSIADESMTSNMDVIMEPEIAYAPTKKQKRSSSGNNFENENDKGAMNDAEKQRLGLELDALMEELPENIISFLKQSTLSGNEVTEDEIEIDFDNLSDGTLFTLRKLLDDYLLEKRKIHLEAEQSKTEVKDELGHKTTEDEPAEEEVDVVGNDPPPVSSSPLGNDDKYDPQCGGGCTMSRNSISESDSSSSESQSSSASEHDGVQSSIPASASNEPLNIRLQNSELGNLDNSNGLLNGHTDKHSVSNSSVGHNCPQEEEENAPPESRQVSPEKQYRAALLKGRFADIIVKAQEKTFEKGDRPDPEKLKLDREELERRRREEKARLQAEARGAEEARRKAQLEAAAEAKRKIELQREAARHALQQMEKTVDIYASNKFIEDLEILSCAPVEHLESSSSFPADDENDILGSFKFQGNVNPLAKIGLKRKNDDMEEEEVEPPPPPPLCIPDTSSNLMEDGEMDNTHHLTNDF